MSDAEFEYEQQRAKEEYQAMLKRAGQTEEEFERELGEWLDAQD